MTTIIKAGHRQGCGLSVRAAAFNLTDMSQQANHYLAEVQQQAAGIVAAANREAEQIRQRAEQEGRRAALDAVEQMLEKKIKQQMQTALPALREAVDELRRAKQSWITQWEKDVVHLAAAIAARVIRRELSTNTDITMDLLSEALQLVTQHSTIKLNLNPDDYIALREQVEVLVGELRDVATADIVANDEIAPGGCRIDTEFGSIDQQIESQLQRIEEELTES